MVKDTGANLSARIAAGKSHPRSDRACLTRAGARNAASMIYDHGGENQPGKLGRQVPLRPNRPPREPPPRLSDHVGALLMGNLCHWPAALRLDAERDLRTEPAGNGVGIYNQRRMPPRGFFHPVAAEAGRAVRRRAAVSSASGFVIKPVGVGTCRSGAGGRDACEFWLVRAGVHVAFSGGVINRSRAAHDPVK